MFKDFDYNKATFFVALFLAFVVAAMSVAMLAIDRRVSLLEESMPDVKDSR